VIPNKIVPFRGVNDVPRVTRLPVTVRVPRLLVTVCVIRLLVTVRVLCLLKLHQNARKLIIFGTKIIFRGEGSQPPPPHHTLSTPTVPRRGSDSPLPYWNPKYATGSIRVSLGRRRALWSAKRRVTLIAKYRSLLWRVSSLTNTHIYSSYWKHGWDDMVLRVSHTARRIGTSRWTMSAPALLTARLRVPLLSNFCLVHNKLVTTQISPPVFFTPIHVMQH